MVARNRHDPKRKNLDDKQLGKNHILRNSKNSFFFTFAKLQNRIKDNRVSEGMKKGPGMRDRRVQRGNGINWIAIGHAVVLRYSITETAIVFCGL